MPTGKRKRSGGAAAGQAEKDKQLWNAARDGKAAEVTRLLAAGADPNGYNYVRACARAASLPAAPAPLPRPCQLRGTHHPHHAAAARRRLAGPPSSWPAPTGTRQSCRRCWARGQTSTPRARYARPAAAPRPLLPAAARSPAVCAAPLLHLAERRHRPHLGQRQRAQGGRAGAAGRASRPQRQERGTPAPPPPRAHCCPPPLAHPPCAPHCCST